MKKLFALIVAIVLAFGSLALAGDIPYDFPAEHNRKIFDDSTAFVTNSSADTSTTYSVSLGEQMTMQSQNIFHSGDSSRARIIMDASMDGTNWSLNLDTLYVTAAATGADSVKIDYEDFSGIAKFFAFVRFRIVESVAAGDSGHVVYRFMVKE